MTIVSPTAPPCEQTAMIVPWNDPVVDSIGFDVRSQYVELFWLNVLGPTATWILRRLAIGFDRYPLGYEVDLSETASALGLGFANGATSPFMRSLQRCVLFGVSHPISGGLAVRRKVPPVARRHLARMPVGLQDAHQGWMHGQQRSDHIERAKVLAAAMVLAGDDPDDLERQLLALGVPAAIAVEATAQALTR